MGKSVWLGQPLINKGFVPRGSRLAGDPQSQTASSGWVALQWARARPTRWVWNQVAPLARAGGVGGGCPRARAGGIGVEGIGARPEPVVRPFEPALRDRPPVNP